MSHPAASVRSIYSGKVNLDSPDELYNLDSNNNSSAEVSSISQSTSSTNNQNLPRVQLEEVSSSQSQHRVTSKNLKSLENSTLVKPTSRFDNNNYNGTNSSLVSTESEYQNDLIDAESLDTEGDNDIIAAPLPLDYADPFSRPLSRNSTTSCLSTTATKDGIEGRRFRRHGPTAYSSHIISGMMQQQQQQQQQQKLFNQQNPAKSLLNNEDEHYTLLDSANASVASLHHTSIYPSTRSSSSSSGSEPTVSSNVKED